MSHAKQVAGPQLFTGVCESIKSEASNRHPWPGLRELFPGRGEQGAGAEQEGMKAREERNG